MAGNGQNDKTNAGGNPPPRGFWNYLILTAIALAMVFDLYDFSSSVFKNEDWNDILKNAIPAAVLLFTFIAPILFTTAAGIVRLVLGLSFASFLILVFAINGVAETVVGSQQAAWIWIVFALLIVFYVSFELRAFLRARMDNLWRTYRMRGFADKFENNGKYLESLSRRKSGPYVFIILLVVLTTIVWARVNVSIEAEKDKANQAKVCLQCQTDLQKLEEIKDGK